MGEDPIQDRVDSMGVSLGFAVSQPRLWRRDSHVVVTEAIAAGAAARHILPEHIGFFRSRGLISRDVAVLGLYVAQGPNTNTRELFDQLAMERRRTNEFRLLGFDMLVSLVEQAREGSMSHQEAVHILFAADPAP